MIAVRFVIADVRRPLLSMSALTDQGYDVSFGINSTITKLDSGSVVEMVRRGNAYFLPATLAKGMSENVHGEVNAAMSSGSSGPTANPAGGVLQSDERDAVMLDEREAETLVTPKLPSEEEQARHHLTHLPYASWCEACVTGRGQEEQHRRKNSHAWPMPVLAMDYCFLAVDERTRRPRRLW